MAHEKYFNLLSDIGDLNSWLSSKTALEDVLKRIVDLVAAYMQTAVCSIYIYSREDDVLVLRATHGLEASSVGHVRLKRGEGVVGKALKELRTIALKEGSKDPAFKSINNINEEKFDAYMAVPVIKGLKRLGVIVLQREINSPFIDAEIATMKIIAAQLTGIISEFSVLAEKNRQELAAEEKKEKKGLPKLIKGKAASTGIAHAPSALFRQQELSEIYALFDSGQVYGLDDFKRAVKATAEQLAGLQAEVGEMLSEIGSMIFAGHQSILTDRAYTGVMEKSISTGGNAPDVIYKLTLEKIRLFNKSPVPLIREKAQDMADIGGRLLNNLLFEQQASFDYAGKVVIANDLFPSDLLLMAGQKVKGIILCRGGVTSHVALLAQSLEIPLVYARSKLLLSLPDATDLIVDGDQGNVYLAPDREVIRRFEDRKAAERQLGEKTGPARTADGVDIKIYTNINLLTDIRLARELPMEGIGLYRTEFPFIIRNSFPTEEEQYEVYRKLVVQMEDRRITFRTLDVGGDKVLSYEEARENNPSLGMRSIRFSLSHEDVFKDQLRAILRAGHEADIRIMFPMISSVDELVMAKDIMHTCMQELRENNVPFNAAPVLGIMVEIPSVVPILGDLAAECSFFSVGTNDLIQYLLAVDRTNENVASYYVPHHPAVLRTLKQIMDVSADSGVEVSICGEMAHEPRYLPFLIGAGFRNLSINPRFFNQMREAIAAISISEAEETAKRLLQASRLSVIQEIIGEP